MQRTRSGSVYRSMVSRINICLDEGEYDKAREILNSAYCLRNSSEMSSAEFEHLRSLVDYKAAVV